MPKSAFKRIDFSVLSANDTFNPLAHCEYKKFIQP